MKKYVAAIDLGTTKVVALVGEKTENGINIISFREAPSKGIMRGEVVNIQSVLDSLNPILSEIKEETSLPIKEVYVGIAGQNIRCETNSNRRLRGKSDDLITEKEIQEMEKEMFHSRVVPGEEVLHIIPQFYNVGEYLGQTNPVGMRGNQIEANYKLFIGKTGSAEASKLVIQRTGMNLKKLILEPVASAKAVLSEDETEMGVAVIDIGGGTTDLLIYEENVIRHAAVVPFGGNSITEDIRQGCGVSQRNAEQIKIQYGTSCADYAPENKIVAIPGIGGREPREVSFKFIASIIEARMEEIVEAVMYEIDKSGYADRLQAGIVITGGGSGLSGLASYIKQKTGYDTRIASPDKNVTFVAAEGCCKPSSSTAVGLIIKGFEYEENNSVILSIPSIRGELFPSQEEVAVEAAPEGTPQTKSKDKEKVKSEKAPKTKGFLGNIPNIFGEMFNPTNDEA